MHQWQREQAERYSRQATLKPCRHCGQPTWQGPDADHGSLDATCDPHTLTWAGELHATAQGRWTYQLRGKQLHRRDLTQRKDPSQWPVVTDHHCTEPIPRTWLATHPDKPQPRIEDL